MAEWTKVVTHPFGLAAFSLFLVFLLASHRTKAANRRLHTVFIVMAFIALLGGISLAFRQLSIQTSGSEKIDQRSQALPPVGPTTVERRENPPSSIQQSTHGANSPAIADVEGNVTIIMKEPDKSNSGK
jgi:hypothetical protein